MVLIVIVCLPQRPAVIGHPSNLWSEARSQEQCHHRSEIALWDGLSHHVHVYLPLRQYVPSILSPLGYADCSPLGARTADSHPPNQPVADIPETDSLIDVSRIGEGCAMYEKCCVFSCMNRFWSIPRMIYQTCWKLHEKLKEMPKVKW